MSLLYGNSQSVADVAHESLIGWLWPTAEVGFPAINVRKRCIAAGELANLIQQMRQGSRLDLIGHHLSGQVWFFAAHSSTS